jgi:hypothetical protein
MISMAQIPPSRISRRQAEISSEVLKPGPQRLSPTQADGFLQYLFSGVARRTRPLRLREGAGVARYLKALAWKTPPGPVRHQLEWLADVIWGTLLQFASFQPQEKPSVIRFLEAHADTYLAGCDFAIALDHVLATAPPALQRSLFPPPHLMSAKESAQGKGNPRLREDLSTRIYVAYRALKSSGVRNAPGRIAEVLNRHGLKTRGWGKIGEVWGSGEVRDRVKQYEQKLKRRSEAASKKRTVAERRGLLVDAWILSFRLYLNWGKPTAEANSAGDDSGA